MTQDQRRIFVYKPPEGDHRPEPDPEEGTDRFQAVDDGQDLGVWLFGPVGAVLVWLATLLITVPVAGVALLILPEQYGVLLAGLGTWLVLGLIIIHWWIPPAHQELRHSEGIAIAGWHVLATAGTSAVFAWILLFPDGRRPVFTMEDVLPLVVICGILLVMFSTVFTLLRGHLPGRGLRYAWTVLCMLAVWMSLWLVAAHGGLIQAG